MDGSWGNLMRIGVFYDGHYFYKVSNYYNYEHKRKARISIKGLHDFIRNEVSAATGHDKKLCQIVDAHYFRGRYSAKKSEETNRLYGERLFDDILMHENVVTHYLPLKNEAGKPQEKGVDVWLALEAYELAIYKRFDVLVLVACDGDYVPLVRKLNTIGSQVMLLSWDFQFQDANNKQQETRTAQQLIEEVSYYVAMHEKIDSRTSNTDALISNLFVSPRKQEQVQTSAVQAAASNERHSDSEKYRESTILRLNKGYGFIEDTSVNNGFFHYSSLENIDFNDLAEGMQVRYLQEAQDDKWVAAKVWVNQST
ncbi:MAG TPA: cold-shock protein [Coriobacteriia bacterium]|nr:cold-shock protein [Coriobacteriia bacterium]